MLFGVSTSRKAVAKDLGTWSNKWLGGWMVVALPYGGPERRGWEVRAHSFKVGESMPYPRRLTTDLPRSSPSYTDKSERVGDLKGGTSQGAHTPRRYRPVLQSGHGPSPGVVGTKAAIRPWPRIPSPRTQPYCLVAAEQGASLLDD